MGGDPLVLVVNSGSSSLKYQLVEPGSGLARASGHVERIGEAVSSGPRFPTTTRRYAARSTN
jgi:acetate kinase